MSGLVSAITIFRDAAPFLPEAIESVLSQDYANWELLLVDDGSTDEGSDIARDYVRQYSGRMKYLEHPDHVNLGMSASRHLGVHHARGDYVAFVDADDVWLPEKLSRQVGLLGRHPDVAMTYGPGLYWYSWTGQQEDLGRDFIQPIQMTGTSVAAPSSLLSSWLCQPFATPGTSGSLVRTEQLRRTRANVDFRGLYEDQVLFCQIAVRHAILVSDDCLYKYRQHDNSCCSLAHMTGVRNDARLSFLQWLDGYLDDERVSDRTVRNAVARELSALRAPAPLTATWRMVARAILSPAARHWIRSRLRARAVTRITRSSPRGPDV